MNYSKSALFSGLCVLFMLTGPALARNREVATLSFGYEGKARLTDLESENGVASVEMVETGARLNFPLYIGDRARVISGFGFKHTRFDFCNVGIERQDVYTVSIPFRTFFDISPKWSFMGSLFPSLYSDFEGVKYDDFKAAAVALGFYEWRPDCKIALGAAYSREFGRDAFYPAAGFTWTPSDKWIVNMLFPRPNVVYKLNHDTDVFVFAVPAGGEWNINERIEDGKKVAFDLSLKGYRAGTGCSYSFSDRISLKIEGGLMFGRNYELRNDDETVFESAIKDTWFVECGIALQ